ncbi:hypothetical protein CONCODRAFT_169149 [Conidiobolus coronatus NRRL 28638]|uniref:Uncharacterized protein n=1 Tax=Conidiobolus coronatus (strain ATCC 28846 / CBS 209.66 / NRRL 28638) TaxID=796925 RepID=A0A137PB78_CONC2|nr:hypothetical protein CONCODRAFT_169149 [Conidiobolus coronatus NRRL 28638]|eukprot:KXN72191.1 hypothetical protein CONCODRAFT_169149 [Conidiobolus coronatus NRRL 28638]
MSPTSRSSLNDEKSTMLEAPEYQAQLVTNAPESELKDVDLSALGLSNKYDIQSDPEKVVMKSSDKSTTENKAVNSEPQSSDPSKQSAGDKSGSQSDKSKGKDLDLGGTGLPPDVNPQQLEDFFKTLDKEGFDPSNPDPSIFEKLAPKLPDNWKSLFGVADNSKAQDASSSPNSHQNPSPDKSIQDSASSGQVGGSQPNPHSMDPSSQQSPDSGKVANQQPSLDQGMGLNIPTGENQPNNGQMQAPSDKSLSNSQQPQDQAAGAPSQQTPGQNPSMPNMNQSTTQEQTQGQYPDKKYPDQSPSMPDIKQLIPQGQAPGQDSGMPDISQLIAQAQGQAPDQGSSMPDISQLIAQAQAQAAPGQQAPNQGQVPSNPDQSPSQQPGQSQSTTQQPQGQSPDQSHGQPGSPALMMLQINKLKAKLQVYLT